MKSFIKSGLGCFMFCLAVVLTVGFLWDNKSHQESNVKTKKEVKKILPIVKHITEGENKTSIQIKVVSLPQASINRKKENRKPKVKTKKRNRLAKKKVIKKPRALTKKELIAIGETLLKKKDDQKFPMIRSDYFSLGKFSDYFSHLVSIGARFFLADNNDRKLKAEILSLTDGRIFSERYPPTSNLVLSRPRKIIGDDSIQSILKKARMEFGSGNYSVVMFLKKCHDARIVGRIFEKIKNDMTINYSKFDHFNGNYKIRKGMLAYNVVKGTLNNGQNVPLSLRFYLTEKCL